MELVLIALCIFALVTFITYRNRKTFKSIDKRLARIESQLGIYYDKQRETQKNN